MTPGPGVAREEHRAGPRRPSILPVHQMIFNIGLSTINNNAAYSVFLNYLQLNEPRRDRPI
jgi:hypothetical protein